MSSVMSSDYVLVIVNVAAFKGSGQTLLCFRRSPAVSGLEPKGHRWTDLWLCVKLAYTWVYYLHYGYIPIRTPHVHLALLCGRKS